MITAIVWLSAFMILAFYCAVDQHNKDKKSNATVSMLVLAVIATLITIKVNT